VYPLILLHPLVWDDKSLPEGVSRRNDMATPGPSSSPSLDKISNLGTYAVMFEEGYKIVY
jgi:hypothetical protein